jgi:hypothetical protein
MLFRDPAHPQRKAVEDCPPGAVFVIDSRKDARAASAGSILVTRLMVRGVAGVVTVHLDVANSRSHASGQDFQLITHRKLAGDKGTGDYGPESSDRERPVNG